MHSINYAVGLCLIAYESHLVEILYLTNEIVSSTCRLHNKDVEGYLRCKHFANMLQKFTYS